MPFPFRNGDWDIKIIISQWAVEEEIFSTALFCVIKNCIRKMNRKLVLCILFM